MNENLPAERRPQVTAGAAVAAFVPQTLDDLYRLSNVMATSGLSAFKTPESAAVAIMAGAELGFGPFQACQSLASINGRAVLWGDSIPALLWANGFKLREWFEEASPDYPDAMTARCEVTRPDGQIIEGEFSVRDAKEAQLWTKAGPWQTARKRMMKMRARSYAARDGAADLLRGLFVAEEVQDYPSNREPSESGAGTGMISRLKAREVDPSGFNVRSIVEETKPTIEDILDGDHIPDHLMSDKPAPTPPKRRGRPPKVREPIQAAQPTAAPDAAHEAQGRRSAPWSAVCMACGAPAGIECKAECLTWDDLDPAGWPAFVKQARNPVVFVLEDGYFRETPLVPADAQNVEPDSLTPDSVTGASGGSPAETSSPAQPVERSDVGASNPDAGRFYTALRGARGFADLQSALTHFRRTETYKTASSLSVRGWQSDLYARANQLREAGAAIPQPEESPWTFLIYLTVTDDSGDVIDSVFDTLQQSVAYGNLSPEQKTNLDTAVSNKLAME